MDKDLKVVSLQDSLERNTLLKQVEELEKKLISVLPLFEDVEDPGTVDYINMGCFPTPLTPLKSLQVIGYSVRNTLEKWESTEEVLNKKKDVLSFVVNTLISLLENEELTRSKVTEFKCAVALKLLK